MQRALGLHAVRRFSFLGRSLPPQTGYTMLRQEVGHSFRVAQSGDGMKRPLS